MFKFKDITTLNETELREELVLVSAYWERLAGIGAALSASTNLVSYLMTCWAPVEKDGGFFNVMKSYEALADLRGMVITAYIDRLTNYEAKIVAAIGFPANDGLLEHVLQERAQGVTQFEDFNQMMGHFINGD